MREIKFRAWDKDIKVWFYWNLRDPFSVTWKMGLPRNLDSKSIGQYTGLKDKNGKEIYEGDIIRANNDVIVCGNWLIEWRDEHCGFVRWKIGGGKKNWLPMFSIADDTEIAEIIGNIYENPDLLNK